MKFLKKLCSGMMAATFMDFNKFGVYSTVLTPWQWKWKTLRQNFDVWLKFLQILPKKFGKFWKKLQCYQMAFLDFKIEFLVSFLVFYFLPIFGNDWIPVDLTEQLGDQWEVSLSLLGGIFEYLVLLWFWCKKNSQLCYPKRDTNIFK